MAVENEANKYDSIFALMDQSDDDEDDDNDEVNFRDVQRNLKSYSPKKLMSLANVLIDAYHSLVSDKDTLTIELGDAEQTRDDLVVCVVDLKETIENLQNEKEVLTEKIASVEHKRDDLMVIVVDLKETIENFSREKSALVEKVVITEQERDDLLVVIVDLEETIEGLKAECRPENSEKGKEVASEAHIKLENELNNVKTSMCAELEKNRQLQAELEKVKNDLEKSLKWTRSSNAITAMYFNNGGNRQGIGFQRDKIPYNPHSKYVTVPALYPLWEQWAFQGKLPSQSPEKGYILGVGKVGKSFSHSIENVFYVNGLKYSLLSVFQICDKGNKVEFLSEVCTVTNLVTGEVVLVAKRYKNIYVADFEYLQSGDMSCLKAVDDNAELWHRRLGYASFSLLNNLIQKNLVRGFPNSKFKEHRVCDACAREKHVKYSFKPKKDVSTSKPLEPIHMDLCGPMRVPSKGGKRYIFVIVDDYSRFTWTLFLRTKDETFEMFVAFVKKIQVKMESKVACIRSDHRTEFDNAKFDEFCSENGITHNFSAPRTPQQNGVV
ncbi:uncharacterized protein [Nicotiana tomentosiformis]|uniref:uncharacterized protein n=1 Tax=Nicotiana tomentosiformis TaxID=4098 RepID=UPI00388C7B0F